MGVWNVLLWIAAAGVFVPVMTWSVECAAALLPPRKRKRGFRRPSIAVLIPAHNEAGGIRNTLQSVLPQMMPCDRTLVIADNCSDATAAIARGCGAHAIDRFDFVRQGKSYALEHGVNSLKAEAFEVFIVIDADCTVHPGTIDALARLALETGRPVQAPYLMDPPSDDSPSLALRALAFLIKNFVRPSGMDRLGLPCFLNGSGMAFPRSLIQGAILGNGKIAEDKWLTIDLAVAGVAPLFCRQGRVTSSLPGTKSAAATQQTRWLHGHLECMLVQGPRLILAVLEQRRCDLLFLALDLFVPPLSLLVLLWWSVFAASLTAGLLGARWLPALLIAFSGACMSLSLAGILWKFRKGNPAKAFLLGPAYIAAQIPYYLGFILNREKKWIPTKRDS